MAGKRASPAEGARLVSFAHQNNRSNMLLPYREPGVTSRIIITTVAIFFCWPFPNAAHEIPDLDGWLQHGQALLSATDSYTAFFYKQERINSRLTDEETIYLKFKKPFKVYMKWIKEPNKGRESLYVEGYNGNRIKVHECGLAGMITMNLDPKATLIMKGSRHPVTDSGIENLVKLIRKNLNKGLKTGEADCRSLGEESVYGRRTLKVEITFPVNPQRGYYCYRAVLNIDALTKLPIKVQIYDWDNALVESYGYEALRLDAGLSEADFDPNNTEYRF
jgi:hypothetical protein